MPEPTKDAKTGLPTGDLNLVPLARLEAAEARLERYRKALEPFAELAKDQFLVNKYTRRVTVPTDWLVTAREALAPDASKEER